jgi:hypothetical protein
MVYEITTKTKIGRTCSEFRDHYESNSLESALSDYDEDLHRYGCTDSTFSVVSYPSFEDCTNRLNAKTINV